MALELRTPGQLSLRSAATDLYSPENLAAHTQAEIANSSQFNRGWQSAGLSEDANALLWKARTAYEAGDQLAGQTYEQQGRDLMSQSQQWAPTVQNMTDVRGLGQALDWAGGAMGNLRSSIRPALGGLAGAAVGAVAAPFTGGVINPMTGARTGAFLAGYDQMTEGANAQAMLDDQIRAERSMQEIGNTSRAAGAVQGALESIVPAGVAGSVAGLGGRAARKQIAEEGLKRTVVKRVGRDAAEEFATEFAQNPVGDVAQNYLKGDDLSNIDWQAALNAGAAGAIAGGGMGALGAGADVAHAQLVRGKDAVTDAAKNPVRTITDGMVAGAGKLGELGGKAVNALEDAVSERVVRDPLTRDIWDKIENEKDKLFERAAGGMTEEEGRSDPTEVDRSRKGFADALAKEILTSEGPGYSAAEREAAKEYAGGKIEYPEFGKRLRQARADAKEASSTESLISALGGKSKKSLMRPTLTDDFGEQEGRDMTDDKLVDDFGTQRRGSVPYNEVKNTIKGLGSSTTVTEPKGPDVDLTGKVSAQNTKSRDPAKKRLFPGEREQTEALKAVLPQGPDQLYGHGSDDALSIDKKEKKTYTLANVLAKQGVDEKLLDAAANNNVAEHQLKQMVSIMSWVRDGMEMSQEATEALAKRFGEKAPKLVRKAYDIAVHDGLAQPDDAKIRAVTSALIREHSSNTAHFDNVSKAMSHEFRSQIPKGKEREVVELLVKKLRDVAKTGTTKKQEAALLEIFGTKQNIAAAMENMVEPEGVSIAAAEEGDERIDPDAGLNEDGEKQGEVGVSKKVEYIEHTEGRYFDLSTVRDSDILHKLKSGRDKKNNADVISGDGVLRKTSHIGMIDREIQKAEEADGRTLSESARGKLVRSIVHKHFPALEAVGPKPRGVSAETLKMYEVRKEAYLRRVKGLATQLNKRFVALKVEDVEAEKLGLQFDPKDVDLTKIRNINTGKHGLADGTLVFETYKADGKTKNKTPFVTSTQMLIAKMFGTTDSNGASTKEYEGKAQMALQLVSDGVASLLEQPSFTGRMGSVSAGKVIWFDDLPNNLTLWHDKRGGERHTVGMAKAQIQEQSKKDTGLSKRTAKMVEVLKKNMTNELGAAERENIAEAISSFDAEIIRDEFDKYATEADVNSLPEPERQKGAASDFDPEVERELGLKNKTSTHTLRSMKVELYELAQINKDKIAELRKGLSKLTADKRVPVLAKIKELQSDNDEIYTAFKEKNDVAVVSLFQTMVSAAKQAEIVGTKKYVEPETAMVGTGTLADYDPEGGIRREENTGLPNTGNLSLDAMLMVGRPGAVKKADPKVLPSLRERKAAEKAAAKPLALDRLENAKERVIELVTGGVDSLLSAIGKMSDAQLAVLKTALFGADKRAEYEARVSAPDTTTKENLTEFRGKKRNVPATETVLRHTGETRGAGEKYLSGIVQSGLMDLSPKKLTDLYFEGKLQKGVPVYKNLHGNKEAITNKIVARKQELNDGHTSKNEAVGNGTANQAGQADTGAPKTGVAKNAGTATGTGSTSSGKEGQGVKSSKQRAENSQRADEDGSKADQDVVKAAADHLTKTLGTHIQRQLATSFGDGSSGEWIEGGGKLADGTVVNLISLALNGDVLGTAFHESFHEFMDVLAKNGGAKTAAVLRRAATSPIMLRKLDALLDGHPEAQRQVKEDPEEAAAFMYQFWAAGVLKIGPDTKSAFQKVKDFLKSIAALFSETLRAEVEAMKKADLEGATVRDILAMFTEGAVANADTRRTVVEALNKNVEAHDAAVQNVGKAFQTLANTAGKFVFSTEGMMDATGNSYIKELARMFHQKAGTAMKKLGHDGVEVFGGYFDGLRSNTNLYMNKVEDILKGYSSEELEVVRKALSTGKKPTSEKALELHGKLTGFFKEMAEYMDKRDVRRLNDDHEWEKVPFRENYWPQVFDIDGLLNDGDKFKETLIKEHSKHLQFMANDATGRLPQADRDAGKVITKEMIADEILVRLLNSHGQKDVDEDMSDLGITPMAAAVNARKLDWLNMDAFDQFMEKDVGKIMSSYTRNMVKRGEYQSRFGYGGQIIRDLSDKAVLSELGMEGMSGERLIEIAEKRLPYAIKAWQKARVEKGDEFAEQFPTLRSVGQKAVKAAMISSAQNTGKTLADVEAAYEKKLAEAVGKLEQSFKAVQAMEGTLGRDISAPMRAANSWIVAYQSVRLLTTMLANSMTDVMGVTVNGGTLGDAWTTFVTGMREVKKSWSKDKTDDALTARAEMFGVLDAGAFMDAISQAQGSVFMSGKAKVFTDKFFHAIGAEGWNRGIRAAAAQVGERLILEMKQKGVDPSDKAAVARFERLYGEGASVDDIKLDEHGLLDINAARNRAAIQRWVLDATPAPNAAHRTIWMSDPHYQAFAHLKNYTYTMHRVLLKGAVAQARLGNYRPAMALAVGYMPIAIAAGAAKEMLIPGDEPAWMKGGLDGYLSYGFSRAGVLGVPQMYADNLFAPTNLFKADKSVADSFDPAALFGPTADQIQGLLSVPIMEDHTILKEALGSMPAGNLLKRLGQ